MERRGFIAGAAALAAAGAKAGETPMFGMIGKITATSSKGGELAQLLMSGSGEMPGCLSYVVAADSANPDVLWVCEAWDSEASHKASLKLPQVQAAIAKARPIIAGFDTVATTRPLGGVGLQGR